MRRCSNPVPSEALLAMIGRQSTVEEQHGSGDEAVLAEVGGEEAATREGSTCADLSTEPLHASPASFAEGEAKAEEGAHASRAPVTVESRPASTRPAACSIDCSIGQGDEGTGGDMAEKEAYTPQTAEAIREAEAGVAGLREQVMELYHLAIEYREAAEELSGQARYVFPLAHAAVSLAGGSLAAPDCLTRLLPELPLLSN